MNLITATWLSTMPDCVPRFERTADMLAKSGLLDITMKTAELIRSNQQAQQELVQLRAEVRLHPEQAELTEFLSR